MVNIIRKLFLIMSNHNHCLISAFAECFYNILHQSAIFQIKAMKRLVKYEQCRVFDKGTSQKNKPLFTAAKFQKRGVGQMSYAKDIHPELAYGSLLRLRLAVQARHIAESACHDVDRWKIFKECAMHLW